MNEWMEMFWTANLLLGIARYLVLRNVTNPGVTALAADCPLLLSAFGLHSCPCLDSWNINQSTVMKKN